MPSQETRLRRRYKPSEAERQLWRHAMRDAVPLTERKLADPPLLAPERRVSAKLDEAPQKIRAPNPPPDPLGFTPAARAPVVPGLDRRTAERLSRGQFPIDGRLDLHGMTQDQARAALDGFVARAWNSGRRNLLVITGKGSASDNTAEPYWQSPGSGVLRAAVPRWLREEPNRGRVLAIAQAQPRHGGGGALYVLIRRRRE